MGLGEGKETVPGGEELHKISGKWTIWDLNPDLTAQLMVFPRQPSRPGGPAGAWELSLRLCGALWVSREPRHDSSPTLPHCPSPHSLPLLSVPYSEDYLSQGHHVQAAIQVLNPLTQFFFPSPDQAKEVICGHRLGEESCRKQTAGGLPASI